jgi:hypothetical protein
MKFNSNNPTLFAVLLLLLAIFGCNACKNEPKMNEKADFVINGDMKVAKFTNNDIVNDNTIPEEKIKNVPLGFVMLQDITDTALVKNRQWFKGDSNLPESDLAEYPAYFEKPGIYKIRLEINHETSIIKYVRATDEGNIAANSPTVTMAETTPPVPTPEEIEAEKKRAADQLRLEEDNKKLAAQAEKDRVAAEKRAQEDAAKMAAIEAKKADLATKNAKVAAMKDDKQRIAEQQRIAAEQQRLVKEQQNQQKAAEQQKMVEQNRLAKLEAEKNRLANEQKHNAEMAIKAKADADRRAAEQRMNEQKNSEQKVADAARQKAAEAKALADAKIAADAKAKASLPKSGRTGAKFNECASAGVEKGTCSITLTPKYKVHLTSINVFSKTAGKVKISCDGKTFSEPVNANSLTFIDIDDNETIDLEPGRTYTLTLTPEAGASLVNNTGCGANSSDYVLALDYNGKAVGFELKYTLR